MVRDDYSCAAVQNICGMSIVVEWRNAHLMKALINVVAKLWVASLVVSALSLPV